MSIPVEKTAFRMLEPDEFASDGTPHVVTDDLMCRTCGYNLRGLSFAGNCPECRTPVDQAMHGDLLRFSEPGWVRLVARGLQVLNISILAGLVGKIAVPIYARMAGMPWIGAGLMLVVGVVAIVGAWVSTSREPAAIGVEPTLSARRVARVSAMLAIAMELGDDWVFLPWRFADSVFQLINVAAWMVAIIAGLRYLMGLARRVPNRDLMANTRTVMWGLVFSWGLMGLITAAAVSSMRSPILTIVFALSCTVVVACIGFTLWSLTLVARYASALGEAANEAQTTWLRARARSEVRDHQAGDAVANDAAS